ncbi:MAG: hypothetical protein Q9223_000260 [Gallowayella weberi]
MASKPAVWRLHTPMIRVKDLAHLPGTQFDTVEQFLFPGSQDCSVLYKPLDNSKDSVEDQHLPGQVWTSSRAFLAGIVVSLLLNVFLAVAILHTSGKAVDHKRTAYGILPAPALPVTAAKVVTAHLRQDFSLAWQSKSRYFGEDDAVADKLWDEISIDNGTVALDDTYAASMGLPLSQRFPWDKNKGLYLLNGYHSLHCLARQLTSDLKQKAKDY